MMRWSKGLRIVAVFEACKGALVLAAGTLFLAVGQRHAEAAAKWFVHLCHLDAASRFPRLFIHAASEVTDAQLWFFAGAAVVYAAVRYGEAYGLWHEKRWAEWFAAFSGGLYIPIELYELGRRVTWTRIAALLINVAIVAYMAYALWETRRKRAHPLPLQA